MRNGIDGRGAVEDGALRSIAVAAPTTARSVTWLLGQVPSM
jgi:hypothetical protein